MRALLSNPSHERWRFEWLPRMAVACALGTAFGAVAGTLDLASGNVPLEGDFAVRPGERLSAWLLRQPEDAAAPGLAWRVPEEEWAQRFLKNSLLLRIEVASRHASREVQADRQRLMSWLQSMPVTGRVALGVLDPRWLQAHPDEDPVLKDGQRLVAPPASLRTVAVVRPDGGICGVQHQAGRSAADYVSTCDPTGGRDWVWVAQPDGRTARIGLAPWNSERGDEPAPGAWIWSAPRDMTDLVAFSEGIIKFLATQGPAPQLAEAVPPIVIASAFSSAEVEPGQSVWHTSRSGGNDWGETGLLQTPTARMGQAGNFRASISNVAPYTRLTFTVQPLDWMEGGFRYTSISNRAYAISTTGQSDKDKSIDLKLRLLGESAYRPEVALGFRDLGGTGLFSSEYLVAGKRYGDFDFSLGVGWGYMGSSGNIRNPLLVFGDRFRIRPAASATGGEAGFRSFFRGPAALFGGVAWNTPWTPLTVKLEYEGNDYRHEPQNNVQTQRTPFNIGIEYRYSPQVAFTVGVERGKRAMFGVTFSTNVASMQTAKIADAPAPRFTPQAPGASAVWASSAADIQSSTEWTVERIALQGDGLHLWISGSGTVYREARLQRIISLLHRDAPASAKAFVLHYQERGLPLHIQVVDRATWVAARDQALTPAERRVPARHEHMPEPAVTTATTSGDGEASGWAQRPEKFVFGITPSFSQIVGGPDAFALYQLGLQATAEYRFIPGTWVNAALNWRIADNFEKFSYTAASNLPRVRTYQREYATGRRLTLPVLQLTHMGRLDGSNYYSVYGGALEPMFAGVGAEWLYRPWRSRFAVGVDVNHVRQRDFAQDFRLRDYAVNTGHATLYWDTGWNGVQVKLSAGRYLAGDKGVTFDVSRRFDNGVTLGAYATRTNVSAAQFGEGRFDKGIYVSVPFDALLPRSSKFSANFNWTPLVRDGGAKLARINPLYEMTGLLDPNAFGIAPPHERTPRAGDNILDFEPTR